MSQAWREMLKNLPPSEKRRVIQELGVTPRTFRRWTTGETDTPHPDTMQHLLNAFPSEKRSMFLDCLHTDPHFQNEEFTTCIQKEIPSTFYARVLNTYQSSEKDMRLSSVCQLVVHQLLQLLDPTAYGLYISVAACSPPYQHVIRTLRVLVAKGTPPWNGVYDQGGYLLGRETFAGQAIINQRPLVLQDVHTINQDSRARSAASFPITLDGMVAGTLTVMSSQPHFFTQIPLFICEQYAVLLSIAFDTFVDYRSVQLGSTPPITEQLPCVARYRQQLASILRNLVNSDNWEEQKHHYEQQALFKLEEELLRLRAESHTHIIHSTERR